MNNHNSQSKKRGAKPDKTPSQLRAEKARETAPGWQVNRRTMASDGTLNLACQVGAVAVDVHVRRGGAETAVLRDPNVLLNAEAIASLITARSQEVRNG